MHIKTDWSLKNIHTFVPSKVRSFVRAVLRSVHHNSSIPTRATEGSLISLKSTQATSRGKDIRPRTCASITECDWRSPLSQAALIQHWCRWDPSLNTSLIRQVSIFCLRHPLNHVLRIELTLLAFATGGSFHCWRRGGSHRPKLFASAGGFYVPFFCSLGE